MKYIIITVSGAVWNGQRFTNSPAPRTYVAQGTALRSARTIAERMRTRHGPNSNMARVLVRAIDNDGNAVKTLNI